MSQNTPTAVTLEVLDNKIALVTIQRPEARNAVSPEVAQALGKIVRQVEADPNIWIVVLTGAGGQVFCAGADLKVVANGGIDGLFTPEGGFAGFVHAPRSKPWIAAVEGLALAGGCEIALACDLIVASQGGGFGLPEVLRGLVASAGGLYRLPRALPKRVALKMILTGERLSSERALELGMVSELVPAGRVVEKAIELGRQIAVNAPLAVRESLAIVRQSDDLTDRELRELSDLAQKRLEQTEDFFEGARAFVDKRPPQWTGR